MGLLNFGKKTEDEYKIDDVAYVLIGNDVKNNGFFYHGVHYSNKLTKYIVRKMKISNIGFVDLKNKTYELVPEDYRGNWIDACDVKVFVDKSNIFKTKQEALNRLVELNHRMIAELYERHIEVQKFKATHK